MEDACFQLEAAKIGENASPVEAKKPPIGKIEVDTISLRGDPPNGFQGDVYRASGSRTPASTGPGAK
jgi:hypothetical protein